MSTHVAAPPVPDRPYRGIRPFRFIDQQIFAAREEEVWKLLSNVTLYRAVLLYGESGTGKSSLINAGLLPRALEDDYIADRIRVQPSLGSEIKVERIRTSAPNEPLVYLPSNFKAPKMGGSDEAFELSLITFRDQIKGFARRRNGSESATSFSEPSKGPTPLLIFDQFEEFITLFEETQRVGKPEEIERARREALQSQHAILRTLVELIQDETLRIKLIFSFREDYLAKLSLLFDVCPELIDQGQRLRPPRAEVLPRIIRAPFADPVLRAHFLRQAGKGGSELSEALAEQIAFDLGRRSEAGVVNLTALQIVCERLWASSDPKSLYETDGLDGLLKAYGKDVFRDVRKEIRDASVLIMTRMLTGSDTRNIVSEEDLAKTSEQKEALSLLVKSQIVRREIRRNIHFYEITSEYLVPWIKEKVAEHRAAEARLLAETERLKAEENLRAHERRNRILTWLLIIVITLLALVVGLGIYARRLYIASQNNLARAENAERVLREQKDEYANLLVESITSTDRQQVVQAATEVLEKDNSLTNLPPRFYINIAGEGQREQARKLKDALTAKGYLVPRINTQGNIAPPTNELRYFRLNEPGMPVPKEIAALLKEASGLQWNDKYISGYENSSNMRPGHFELWFAAPPGTTTGWLRTVPVDENDNRIAGISFSIKVFKSNGEPVKSQRWGWVPLPQGDYRVEVTAEGYAPATQDFSIEGGKETSLPVKLTRQR